MSKPRTAAYTAVRFQVPAVQLDAMKAAATSANLTLLRWASEALTAGCLAPDSLPSRYRALTDLRSVFLELAPELADRVKRTAAHVGEKRAAFARRCFAHALDNPRN